MGEDTRGCKRTQEDGIGLREEEGGLKEDAVGCNRCYRNNSNNKCYRRTMC